MTRTSQSVRYKINDSIINGSGVGMPLGLLGYAATVSIAKVSGQSAATLVTDNVSQMFAACLGMSQAVWVIANDAFPQLIQMTVGNCPIWTPEGSLGASPAGYLLGRPIILSQSCQTLGTQGDIFLLNLKSYSVITKAGGVETATSMHLWFDYNDQAFRVVFRMDGKPTIRNKVTPARGSFYLSPFVTLDTRA